MASEIATGQNGVTGPDRAAGPNGAERIGRYELRRIVGQGASGVVHEAWDPDSRQRVAVKVIRLVQADDRDGEDRLLRFQREAQAAGRLNHPCIVRVLDAGETAHLAYIVMEFVEGQSLKDALEAEARFTLDQTVGIMRDVLAGLQCSHEHGVVHRDIKPANLMLTPDGRVKIADFGVARLQDSSLTQTGTMIGTPAYMSPEQLMAQPVDARSDIYSAGVVLYQMLAGERPFDGSMASIIYKALNTQAARPSALSVAVPPALDGVVARAMARSPDARYPDAAAFAAALQMAVASVRRSASALDATVIAPPPAAVLSAPGAFSGLAALAHHPAAAEDDEPVDDEPEARHRSPLLISLCILIAIGGAGYLAWTRVQDMFDAAQATNSAYGDTSGYAPQGSPARHAGR